MDNQDKSSLHLTYQLSSKSGDLHDDGFRTTHEGYVWAKGGGARALIGTVSVSRLQVERCVASDSPICDLFDDTDEILQLHNALFDGNGILDGELGAFRGHVVDAFPFVEEGRDLLLIDWVQLVPEARGLKVGVEVVRRLLRDHASGCTLVLVEPNALKTAKISQAKMNRYWEGLGFSRIGKTSWWALDAEDVAKFTNFDSDEWAEFSLTLPDCAWESNDRLPVVEDMPAIASPLYPHVLVAEEIKRIKHLSAFGVREIKVIDSSRIEFARGRSEGPDPVAELIRVGLPDLTWVSVAVGEGISQGKVVMTAYDQ